MNVEIMARLIAVQRKFDENSSTEAKYENTIVFTMPLPKLMSEYPQNHNGTNPLRKSGTVAIKNRKKVFLQRPYVCGRLEE